MRKHVMLVGLASVAVGLVGRRAANDPEVTNREQELSATQRSVLADDAVTEQERLMAFRAFESCLLENGMQVESFTLRQHGAQEWVIVAPASMAIDQQDDVQTDCFNEEFAEVSATYIAQHQRSPVEEAAFAAEIAACMRAIGVSFRGQRWDSRRDLAELAEAEYERCYDQIDP